LLIALIVGLAFWIYRAVAGGAFQRMSLKAYDGFEVHVKDLLEIKDYWLKVLGLYFWISIRIALWMLPLYLAGFALLFVGLSDFSSLNFLLSLISGLILMSCGLVLGYIIMYRYAFAPFLLFEDPNKDINEVMRDSAVLTRGFKGQLFLLDLSFFWWWCLVVVTFGLALLYVGPYHTLARAGMYRAISYIKALQAKPAVSSVVEPFGAAEVESLQTTEVETLDQAAEVKPLDSELEPLIAS
jgi:uncharacterized membrane protein